MAIWVTKTIWLMSLVTYVITAPAGNYQQRNEHYGSLMTVIAESAPSSQYHAQDELGQYSYGYKSADGQSKAEVKGIDGSIAGMYSYIDANGKKVEVSYIADDNGFRVVGNHLPSHNMVLPNNFQQPDIGKNKVAKKKNEENARKSKKDSEEEEDDDDDDGESDEESEEKKKTVKIPELLTKKKPLQVYTVAKKPPLSYAHQQVAIFRLSNFPMTIHTSSASGQSHPQLVHVAQATHASQPAITQHAQPAKSHMSTIHKQHPSVNQDILATRAPLANEKQDTMPQLSKAIATSTSYQLIQATPIKANQHSFHTYIPALPSQHQAKQKLKYSGKKNQKLGRTHASIQQKYSGQMTTPHLALLPGYGYVPTQYSTFQ